MKSSNNNKNFILTGADGGTFYTLVIALPLIFSLIFSVILVACGLDTNADFTKSPLYIYLSFIIPSLSLFLVLLYTTKKNNLDFGQSINLKKCDKKYYLIAVCLVFGALFGLGWVNDTFIEFLQKQGAELSEIVLPKRGFHDFLLCTVIICALPAIFEECVFRGLLLNGARKAGDLFAILACGILFSLYHKNPSQTVYQFIIGAVLAILALKSGSILPSMLFHFINNFYVVVYYFLAPDGYAFDKTVQIVLCVLGVIAFVLATLYLIFKCEKPERDANLDNDYAKITKKSDEIKFFVLFALPGVFAALFVWVINLL